MTPGLDVTLAQLLNELDLLTKEEAVAGYRDNDALYVGKIMVFNTAKGGVASAWMLHEMKLRGVAPKAILFNNVNPILAQGAALADMAMCDRFVDGDVTRLIRTGDQVEVRPEQGLVTITRSSGR